jgi:hypothetical protein
VHQRVNHTPLLHGLRAQAQKAIGDAVRDPSFARALGTRTPPRFPPFFFTLGRNLAGAALAQPLRDAVGDALRACSMEIVAPAVDGALRAAAAEKKDAELAEIRV